MKPIAILFVLAAVPLMPGAASAQYVMVSPMLYHGPQIAFRDHQNAQKAGDTAAPDARAAPVGPDAFRYAADAKRRQANLAGFVTQIRKTDPALADQMAGIFAGGAFFAQIQTSLDAYDMRVDNLADAYAVYWVNAWSASRGNNDTPTPATMTAVRAQATRALADTAALRGASDATKQELAESLWIQSAMIDGGMENAKGKPDELRALGAAAAQGARAIGLDLSTMTLSGKGFVSSR